MKLLIRHSLDYTYSEPVFLEPILVRLQPLCNPFQQVCHHRFQVVPEPDGSSPLIDTVGNSALRLWFTGKHQRMKLQVEAEVNTNRENPFDFTLKAGFERVPFCYPYSTRELLLPYLAECTSPSVLELTKRTIGDSAGETVPFLMQLIQVIQRELRLRRRPQGDPRPPEKTLKLGEGACRDLAVLFAQACRSAGIASRFVSGYCLQPQLSRPELHAWCEVYLPGGGWRGFDPSTGLAVGSSYVALATGPTHHQARPVSGTFRGPARSRLKTRIQIEVL